MAVCCQNLTLGALSSRSALSGLVGALFKKFGLFLNKPCISCSRNDIPDKRVFAFCGLSGFYRMPSVIG
jgi:hypothetical protein